MKKLLPLLTLLLLALLSCSPAVPAVPALLTADAGEKSVSLSWGTAEGAEFYRIYRDDGGTGVFKFIDDTTAGEYTDSGVKGGMTYVYKVCAVAGKNESDGAVSGAVHIYADNESPAAALSVPSITSVTKMDRYTNAVMISSPDEDCTYEVERCPDIDGVYEAAGSTEDNVFYDEEAYGDEYYYRVSAVRGEERSAASSPVPTGRNARSVFRVPVIMYHEFVTEEDIASGIAFDEYAIWQSEFENDLIWLKSNGYTTVTAEQLIDAMEGKVELPARPILLTADDGKYGVYKNAYPILKKYGMTMSLALIGYEIDSATDNTEARDKSAAPFCTWSEIAEMSESGAVEMISHTQSMHVFSHENRQGANTSPDDTFDTFLPAAQADFAAFNSNMREHIGKTTRAMAYPYSKRTVTADRAWVRAGYKLLLGGDDPAERKTLSNYFVYGAGANSRSAVLRRLPRMTGIPLSSYLDEAQDHDER